MLAYTKSIQKKEINMRELKNFTPSPKKDEKVEERVDVKASSSVEDMIKQREGNSEDQLMAELLSTVKKSKAEGRFSESEMENFKKTVTPLLTPEQRKKLDEILTLIK